MPYLKSGTPFVYDDTTGNIIGVRDAAGNESTFGVNVLAQSGAAVSCAADTNENVLATITVPAGLIGPNGWIRVSPLWTHTNSANNKTMRVRLGGAAGTQYMAAVATTTETFDRVVVIRAAAATNVQKGMAAATVAMTSSGSLVTSSVDMNAATTIVISGQKASAGETLTLAGYTIEYSR